MVQKMNHYGLQLGPLVSLETLCDEDFGVKERNLWLVSKCVLTNLFLGFSQQKPHFMECCVNNC